MSGAFGIGVFLRRGVVSHAALLGFGGVSAGALWSETLLAEPTTAPPDPENLVWEGLAEFQRGQYRSSIKHFEAAYALQPNVDILFDLARSFGRLGECEVARQHVQRYLDEVPEPPREYFDGAEDLEVDCPGITRRAPPAGSLSVETPSEPKMRTAPSAGSREPSPVLGSGAEALSSKKHSGAGPGETPASVAAAEPWAYGLLVAGGLSAVASVAYAVGALSTKRDLEGLSRDLVGDPSRTWDEASPLVSRQERQADLALAFGGAAVLLEAAGLLLLLEPWQEGSGSATGWSLEAVKVRAHARGVWCGYEGAL